MQSTDSFNAGLALAMRDLEIRGAGEILGEKQSGLVHDVGLNLFSEMIKKAKHLLKGMPEDKIIDTSINLNVPAYIENDYLPQAELRLEMYKRLAECKTLDELEILKDEIAIFKNDILNDISTKGNKKLNPVEDYSKWGPTESIKLNKIKLATAKNMSNSWSNIPHVTQFDNADITNLFRIYKKIKLSNKDSKIKVSLVPFYMKVITQALSEFPNLNSSLNETYCNIFYKD